MDKPRIAKYDEATDRIDFGGELHYYINLDEMREKAGLKEPLLKDYVGHDYHGAMFVSAIQLNSHPRPGMGYNQQEMDAYLADQSVIHSMVEAINKENALRPAKRAAEEERRSAAGKEHMR